MAVDGTRPPTIIVPGNFMPSSMSADGQWLFLNHRPSAAVSDIWVQQAGAEPRPLVATPANEDSPEISPDGRWLAYSSDETGRREIYLQAFPGPGPRRQVSVGGGESPRWRPDGRALLFLQAEADSAQRRLMTVGIRDDGSVADASPREIASGAFRTLAGLSAWDVHPDGTRALLIDGGGGQADPVTSLEVILNWSAQAHARVGR